MRLRVKSVCMWIRLTGQIYRYRNRFAPVASTIRLWIKRYVNAGISGLKSQKQPIIELQLEMLLNKSPQEYG